jgi:multiple sugar transport system permease protein
MSGTRRLATVAAAQHAGLLVTAAVVLFPFLWIAAAGFKTQIALLTGDVLFTPTLANFAAVLFSTSSDYLRNFGNSLIVGLASTVLVLIVATLAAYSLQRLNWPRWTVHLLLGWSVVFQMIPPITLAGAWYVMFGALGVNNTYVGLILAHTTLNLPLALWMMTIFIADLPAELVEAARIDGADTPQILWWIIVPVVRPGLAAAGVLSFIFSWNEFAVALTLTQRATATVPVAIGKFAQENAVDYTQMAAASLLATVPAVILLLVAQRSIVRGLTAGAVK